MAGNENEISVHSVNTRRYSSSFHKKSQKYKHTPFFHSQWPLFYNRVGTKRCHHFVIQVVVVAFDDLVNPS
jgi:hypothetical protein